MQARASVRRLDRMSSVPESLMAQIVEAPEDDAPRLVYADWLLERDDPRGELLRLQCALASADETGEADANAEQLRRREIELLERFGAEWIAPLADFGARPEFERGLLRVHHALIGSFLQKRHQQALNEHLPRLGVGHLILRGSTKRVPQLAACAALQWTPELTWYDCQLDDRGIDALLTSPHLRRLSALGLEKLRCTDAGLKALAQTNALPRLRRLALLAPVHGGRFTAPGVLALLTSEHFTLRELHLTTAFRVQLAALAAGPAAGLSRLHKLSLRLGRDFAPIASCPHLTELRELHVDAYDRAFSDDSIAALLDNPALAKLRRFTFQQPTDGEPISPKLLERLAERFEAA